MRYAQPIEESSQVPARCLLALFIVVWGLLAIAPIYRSDWALENVLTVLFLWWLVRRHRLQPLTTGAYLMIFLFGSMHSIGAHYTYSEVPYDAWSRGLIGISINETLGLERNHFDRLVHFLFGLLLFRPVQELYLSTSVVRGVWAYVTPVAILWGLSSLYEIVEWWAAELFGGELGAAYLGMQGDVWDTQKDMLAAHLGAIIGALFCAAMLPWIIKETQTVSGIHVIPKYVVRPKHD